MPKAVQRGGCPSGVGRLARSAPTYYHRESRNTGNRRGYQSRWPARQAVPRGLVGTPQARGRGGGQGGRAGGDSGVASGKAISHYGLLFGRWRISGPHHPRRREQPTWNFDTPGIHIIHIALRSASGQGITNASPPEGRRAQARTRLLAMGGKASGRGLQFKLLEVPRARSPTPTRDSPQLTL